MLRRGSAHHWQRGDRRRGVIAPKAILGFARGNLLRLHPAVHATSRTRADRLPRVTRRATGGRVELARGVRLFEGVRFFLRTPQSSISIGPGTYLNRRTELHCERSIAIGAGCAVAWDVHILDSDHHALDGDDQSADVVIGDHVWIGSRVTILKGVHVGDGAVIAAGSVVATDVPAGSLVGGVPARVLRTEVTWT
jgi:acetyltransferase-like isoleucine patch superfamily enzyme